MAETALIAAVRISTKPPEIESILLPKRQEYALSHTTCDYTHNVAVSAKIWVKLDKVLL
jgi:hypothetical protein